MESKRGYLESDFRLFHLKDKRGTDVGTHCHDFHKIVMLLSGHGDYIIDGRRYELMPGDIAVVGALTPHRPEFEAGSLYERIILYISPEYVRSLSGRDDALDACFSGAESHVLRAGGFSRENIDAFTAQLEKEAEGGGFAGRALCSALVTALLVDLNRAFLKKSSLVPAMTGGGRFGEILTYVDGHFTDDISVEKLAERFYISRFHLMRQFREMTGKPIHEYISDKRLSMARRMILSGVPAMDACYRSGFRSYSAFARAHEKLYGIAPTGRRITRLPASPDAE